ncbi:hypothetical protein SAMN04489761_2747 [Tenacibaculum sp. MAR_2009_124]|uniref:hypothetical protein n=1 Tax=Tenacibaculum sp. MAR_2009_124 TaxID=1250059 RepID=UPI00089C9B7E|nr:hypothetical protein [Tenacibaculum sp. MAR_2009_124]SEC35008.1 hypothetical protein SAMN04489761_2747 [Tenacibaculum sp. MAR_2009_124]
MELTTLQTQKIENYLDNKGIYYVDIRIEILDHLVTDIEFQLKNDVSFEKAFSESTMKWNSSLVDTSSYHIGYVYSKPKFVIEKLKTLIKWHNFKIMGVLTLFIMIRPFIRPTPLISAELINKTLGYLIYFQSLLLLIGYAIILKSKIKTSYRFIYQSQILGYLFIPLVFTISPAAKNGNLDAAIFMFFSMSIFVFILGIKVFRKHLEFVKMNIA